MRTLLELLRGLSFANADHSATVTSSLNSPGTPVATTEMPVNSVRNGQIAKSYNSKISLSSAEDHQPKTETSSS